MKTLIHAIVAALLFLHALNSNAAAIIGAASVTITERGEWRPLAVGQLVASQEIGTGPRTYWKVLPAILTPPALEHYFLTPDPSKTKAEHYGQLTFQVKLDGTILLLAPGRGDNEPLLQKLVAQGWKIAARDVKVELGYDSFGKNGAFQDWVLLERFCKTGEQHSLRVDTYQAPVILRRVGQLKASKSSNGRLQISASGDVGVYNLQSSDDLITWTDDFDVTLLFPASDFQPVATAGFGAKTRFYRLLRIPLAP